MFIPSQKKLPANLVLGACLTQNLLLFQTRQPFPATQANQASFAGAINHHEAPWSPSQRGTKSFAESSPKDQRVPDHSRAHCPGKQGSCCAVRTLWRNISCCRAFPTTWVHSRRNLPGITWFCLKIERVETMPLHRTKTRQNQRIS